MATYRRVVNGKLNGTFEGTGKGVKVGSENIPYSQLEHRNIFAQIKPNYDPNIQIVDENYHFDPVQKKVIKNVYDFEKGIALNWKAKEHVNGELYRKIRVRVLRQDSFVGGSLEVLADKAIKTSAPRYDVDINGEEDATGAYSEIYLVELDPNDEIAIQAYVDANVGAILQKYDEINLVLVSAEDAVNYTEVYTINAEINGNFVKKFYANTKELSE